MMNLKNLPQSPGVYKMKDKEGKIIYVGKAKNLSNRIKTYFQKDYAHSTRTRKLVEATADVEYIETDTELEALLLENNLIKELRPRYNILMKDDKSYVYVKVDLDEDFPAVTLVRERVIKQTGKGHARYFGPKLATSKVYETLRMLKKLFPFRHCKLNIKWREQCKKLSIEDNENLSLSPDKELVEVTNKVIDFPCLDYYIKRCPGPCIGAIPPEMYKKIIQQVMNFLDGKSEDLEKSLKAQMAEAAGNKLFEKAARIRDKLFAIQGITERQKITDIERQDTDVINFTAELGRVFFNVFMVRGGKLISQENFMLDAFEINEKDITLDAVETLESFLIQYYEKAADIPKEIFIPHELEDKETLEKWLAKKKNEAVHILNPKKGEKNKLLELSLKNAVSFAKQYRIKWMSELAKEGALARLCEVLGLKEKSLKRIEGFDISHLGGENTVGSMVVFENGNPKNQDYRHFKMRTVANKPDDYRSMEEVLMRRLKYLSGSVKNEELKMKQPTKKDLEEIKIIMKRESLSQDGLDKKGTLIVKRGAKIIGFGRLHKLDEKVTVMASLWVSPSERGKQLGYRIMEKLIARSKLKRIYINTNKSLEDYYSIFGFIVLHEQPAVLKKRMLSVLKHPGIDFTGKDLLSMVFDATKHKRDPSFGKKPDLILVDGGKGQLSTALFVLKRLKLEIPVIALAKNLEEIYVPGAAAPILLEEGDEALKLLQRIRDEAHRFAITFGRELHVKKLIPR